MNSIYIAYIIGTSVATTSAIVGATYLASIDKDGWCWLIFAAIAIGSYSFKIKKKGDSDEPNT